MNFGIPDPVLMVMVFIIGGTFLFSVIAVVSVVSVVSVTIGPGFRGASWAARVEVA